MTGPMNYVDPPDVPEGMTLCQYRARGCVDREADAPRSGLWRLLRLGRTRAVADRVPAPRASAG